MHVSVHKFTRTARPRSASETSGAELSHPFAAPSCGICERAEAGLTSSPFRDRRASCAARAPTFVVPAPRRTREALGLLPGDEGAGGRGQFVNESSAVSSAGRHGLTSARWVPEG